MEHHEGPEVPEAPGPPFEEPASRILNVMPGVGPYHTIQEAIQAAQPGCHIIVAQGLYTQPIAITKPGLVIRSRDSSSEVQLTCAKGPLVSISLEPDQTFKLKGFKLIHTAVPERRQEPSMMAGDVYMELCESTRTTEYWIRGLKINRSMNCALWVDGGVVTVEECSITLSSAKTPLPAVVCSSGHLIMDGCEVKGHGELPSVGIYLSDADMTVKKCRIYRHRGSGLVLQSKPNAEVKILESQILANVNCGVLCIGDDSNPTIERCKIAHNEGSGIKISNLCNARIKACEIKKNEHGIEVENGDPFIFLNIIKDNEHEGVLLRADSDFRCDGKLMSNDIFNNKIGVLCSGSTCHTVIQGNGRISNNQLAGVKVTELAHVVIIRNEIYENQGQGILITKGSSAHIERNNIYSNTKANIAYGGDSNSDTTIIENSIYRGASEGIFNIEGGTSWIKRNQIYENTDGIVILDSHPIISMNSIYDNKRSGITAGGRSQASILENEVFRNTAVGINIRDMSSGLVLRNYTFGNLVQMAIITKTKMNIKQIKKENVIKGELQLPVPAICSLV